jgi:hypothetical protein
VLLCLEIEACQTGRPWLMLSHLLTVKITIHGRLMRRYGITSPSARAFGFKSAKR